MEDDSDHFQEEEPKPQEETHYQEEEIRISSNGSSPYLEESKVTQPATNNFEMFDQIISKIEPQSSVKSQTQALPEPKIEPKIEPIVPPPEQEPPAKDKPDQSIIQSIQKQWIIKEAELQRIGGTQDFFNFHLEKYKKHLLARKIVLSNISGAIDKNKIVRAHPIMLLKEYFKEYASLSSDFHQRCYKYEFPQREESDNRLINMRVVLRTGLERLFNLRKQTGNQMSRLEKFMRSTTITKLDKAVEVYWGVMASHQAKPNAKREHFQEKEKKFQKRIEKIAKVYGKGRLGNEIDEDVFQEMIKFVKEERQLRFCIYDWGKEMLNLRKNIMNADYGFFNELEAILTEYKNFNDTVYQLQKKKYNFVERLKKNIESNYQFDKLCTPLDNDYIMSVLNYKTKGSISLLKQEDYEQFINQEYFGDIIGETTEFLKGTIIKSFPLKNPDEELVKTVSGNLLHYNKKNLDIKYKMKTANTKAEFQGNGRVKLKEIVKGIIFDSEHQQHVFFKDDNRAEEIVLYLSGEFGTDLP